VKINGHRIEPGEIAAVLAEHPAVRQAAVVPQRGATGDMQLIAYVVSREERAPPDLIAQLARHAAERLPVYMMAASFVRVAALPLKPNGKLNVAALPLAAPLEAALTRHQSEEHPGDALVLAVIGEVLGRPVSRDDNLYALGANSLRLVRLVTRFKSRLGLDLPIGEVVKRADVADILRLAAEQRPSAEDDGFLAQIRDLYENEPSR
jgi:aryl carrier-like protein